MAREGLMDDSGYEFYVDEDAWNDGFKEGFLKGIDEFAERISVYGTFDYQGNTINVLEIAEQLKGE